MPAIAGAANVVVNSGRLVGAVRHLVNAGHSVAEATRRVYGVVQRSLSSPASMEIVPAGHSGSNYVGEIEDVDMSTEAPSNTSEYPLIEEKEDFMDVSGDLPSNGVYEDISRSGFVPRHGSHLIKMRRYSKRRFSKKRSRRGYRKRKKYVTKRGVKALISRNVRFTNQKVEYLVQNKFWCGGGWGKRAFQVVPFNYTQASWGDINSIDSFVTSKLALDTAVTPGTAEFAKAYTGVYSRAAMAKFMFHSSLNEDVIATFWVIKPKFAKTLSTTDTIQEWWSSLSYPYSYSGGTYNFAKPNLGPLYRWYLEWYENQSVSEGYTFESDFTTFPTKYAQFNKEYKILKKYKVIFKPGETKTLRMKVPGIMFNSQTSEISLGNIGVGQDNFTRFLMVMVEGVPTHQNNAGTEDESVIGRTIGRLEGTYDIVRRVGGFTTQPMEWQFKDFNYDTVTAARSIVTASAAQIQTT